ncbi:hypothetical protein BDR06DRAFT_977692 [Suillus hirtellus]|nr:hypothetical protein BDR06DRAFT_977692 [Suillus hirtellus]
MAKEPSTLPTVALMIMLVCWLVVEFAVLIEEGKRLGGKPDVIGDDKLVDVSVDLICNRNTTWITSCGEIDGCIGKGRCQKATGVPGSQNGGIGPVVVVVTITGIPLVLGHHDPAHPNQMLQFKTPSANDQEDNTYFIASGATINFSALMRRLVEAWTWTSITPMVHSI